jgi:hypothetical protein
MPLSFNWIGHGSSKAVIGVRVPVGVQITGELPEWLLEQPAKLWPLRGPVGSNPTLSAGFYLEF